MNKVLNGHTSIETAFLIDDYPYSFNLRCKMRVWIDTATKGAKKGQQRVMCQTTDPRMPIEFWNKPKAGVYSYMVVLYLDDQGHVQNDGIQFYQGPEKFVPFRKDYFDQLDDAARKRFEQLEAMSRKTNPTSWAEHDASI